VPWLGLPAESLRDRVGIAALDAAVLLASGMTAYLEFPFLAVATSALEAQAAAVADSGRHRHQA
jgi:hypothetical protein